MCRPGSIRRRADVSHERAVERAARRCRARQPRTLARLSAIPVSRPPPSVSWFRPGPTFRPKSSRFVGRDHGAKRLRERPLGQRRLLPDAPHSRAQRRDVQQRSGRAGLSRPSSRAPSPNASFPCEDPIGHDSSRPAAATRPTKIVGVVGDVRERGFVSAGAASSTGAGYNPYWPDQRFLVRTSPAGRLDGG